MADGEIRFLPPHQHRYSYFVLRRLQDFDQSHSLPAELKSPRQTRFPSLPVAVLEHEGGSCRQSLSLAAELLVPGHILPSLLVVALGHVLVPFFLMLTHGAGVISFLGVAVAPTLPVHI